MVYPDRVIRGIANPKFIDLEGRVSIEAFSFDNVDRDDGFLEASVNWYDNDDALKMINKYGPENFETEVIETCPADISMERERFWISSYNSMESGYNETYGGKGKNFVDYKSVCEVFNMTRSEKETASILGIDSNTVRSALKQFGIKTPDRYESQVVTAKPVTAYTRDGKYIESFISVHDAVRWVNQTSGRADKRSESTMRSHIVDVCNGNRKSAYGYIWSF